MTGASRYRFACNLVFVNLACLLTTFRICVAVVKACTAVFGFGTGEIDRVRDSAEYLPVTLSGLHYWYSTGLTALENTDS